MIIYVPVGKVIHGSDHKRVYGKHIMHADTKKTQRRFISINCCPYSRLNLLDQLLNCDVYGTHMNNKLADAVYMFDVTSKCVTNLSANDIIQAEDDFKKIHPSFIKFDAKDVKYSFS